MLLANLYVTGDLSGLLLDYLGQCGIDDPALTEPLRRSTPNSPLTFQAWWALLEQVQARQPDRPVGVELGLTIRPRHLGVLGYLTLSCDNVGEALQRFERYQRLLHAGDRAHVEIRGDEVCLRWSCDYGPSTRLSDEVLLVGLTRFVRMMTGDEQLNPSRVYFVNPAPADLSAHTAVFRCPMLFEQPCVALCFPLTHLQRKVTNADPGLKNLLEQQAQALLAVLPRQEDFERDLQQAIVKAIQNGEPTLEQVAASLALSPRTLHRRLAEKQLVFKELLQQLRLQLARQYLHERRLSLSEIALLLGYSEQSAFTRAFRQWTGKTPLQYQKQSLQG